MRRALARVGAVTAMSLVVAALCGVTLLAPAAHATAGTGPSQRPTAHPFGDPQTVEIGRDGDVVQVVWRVGMVDDLTLLGIHLGVLPEDRILLDGAITYEDGDGAAVAAAPELRDYLLTAITVAVDGAACDGEVVAVDDLLADGATVQFTCPTTPTRADVEVTTLTDLHPAYRTLAAGPDGQRAVYGGETSSQAWTLPDGSAVLATSDAPTTTDATTTDATATDATGAGLGRSAAVQMGAVLGVLLLISLGVLGLRRTRTVPAPITPAKEIRS